MYLPTYSSLAVLVQDMNITGKTNIEVNQPSSLRLHVSHFHTLPIIYLKYVCLWRSIMYVICIYGGSRKEEGKIAKLT